jgi:hypothetical protein
MSYEDDLESALGLFSASSEFYPEFSSLCQERVIDAFPDQMNEDDD